MNPKRAFLIITVGIVALVAIRHLIVVDPLERLSREGDEYTGSWFFPRGGPYILGFESPAEASLRIDGRVVARGKGSVTNRVVYERPGPYAVSFRGPEGARLLWHPPGRRGPPEYVPPSSLSPASPENANFAGDVGASWVDGGVALALLLLVLSPVFVRLWRRARSLPFPVKRSIVVIFVLALGIRVWGVGAQGQTWDEDVNWASGRNYVTNILDGDFAQSSWRWNHQHPPASKVLYGMAAQWSDGFGTARLVAALLTSLSCVLVLLIATRLYNLRVGVVSGLVASLMPHLVAHGQVVGHEAIAVFLWALVIWWSLRVCDDQGAGSNSRLVILGVGVGLAIASRFVNGLVAPIVWLIVVMTAAPEKRLGLAIRTVAIVGVVAVLTLYALWPSLWHDPFGHLFTAWAKLRGLHGFEPFFGRLTNAPPRWYFLGYFVFTTPAVLLALLFGFFVRSMVTRERAALLIVAWLVVPFAVSMSPVRQDGVRYILPALLATSIAVGAGFDWFAQLVSRWLPDFIDRVFAVLLAGYLFAQCWMVGPYYLDYYNELAGGPNTVFREQKFEVAWWGEGLDQAVAYINKNVPHGARVYGRRGGRCVQPNHLAWLRGDLWEREVLAVAQAEWILWYSPASTRCDVPEDAVLMHEVRVRGAPMARVYRVGS